MEQYISKAALVAEIDKWKEDARKGLSDYAEGVYDTCEKILLFLDTFEVKEVKEEPVSNDLEEEYDNYTKHILAYDVQFKPFTHLHNCAKYFFELGLKAQKGE